MKKNLGIKPYLYPMPVLMIGTYNDDNTVNVMNMAWGGICAEDRVALNISTSHKTTENIRQRLAFTLAIADLPHLKEADFFGMASGNRMLDKFARSGLHAVKSQQVDAPVIVEFPLTLECEVDEIQNQSYGCRVLAKIQNVLADDSVLDESGKVNPAKLKAFAFDPFQNGYYEIGDKVGQAWSSGTSLMK